VIVDTEDSNRHGPLIDRRTNSIGIIERVACSEFWRIWTALAATASLSAGASSLDPNKSISQFAHTSWTAKDGIPGPVRAIAQTKDGYLWLGTPAGLYRFDGVHFVSWEGAAGGETLPRKSIWTLLAARDGSLWIGFSSGPIGRLQNGLLKTYSTRDRLNNGVMSFAESSDGRIWACGEGALDRFEDGQWIREAAFPAPGAQRMAVDRDGTLWVATNGKNFGLAGDVIRVNTILKLAPGSKVFETTGQPVGQILQLREAPDGTMWMVHYNERAVGGVFHSPAPDVARALAGGPTAIIFDGRSVWVSLYHSGVRRLTDFADLDKAGFDSYQEADGLSSDGVRALFQDREGNVWVGTNKGVDRFRENKVTPLSRKEGIDENLSIMMATAPDGLVWFTNYAGGVTWHIAAGRALGELIPRRTPSEPVRTLSLHAAKDRLWLGGGFGLATITNGKFSYVPVPGLRPDDSVEAITEDSSGTLWTVVWGGNRSRLRRRRNGEWKDFPDMPELPFNRCRVAVADSKGRVWFGFESGEVAVVENEWFHVYKTSDGLPPGKILAIASDRTGHTWVGGEGGISRLDGRGFKPVTKKNGIPEDLVSAIAEDDDGFLWIAGSRGIVRVAEAELERAFAQPSYHMQTLLLDTTDGVPGPPIAGLWPSAAKTPDGRLWFATTDGIAVVDPRRLPINRAPPPVVIQSVAAGNQSFPASSALHLRAGSRNVEITFAALSFSVPERVRFRYKLEGYDDDWRGPITDRSASYTNLSPRNYRFRVIAANDDGVWNETGATLAFSIDPLFYQTIWFLLICVAAAAGILLAAIRWRMRLMADRLAAQFQERLAERTRIAQDLHDTLLQGFISASLQLSLANRELSADSKAKSIVTEVLELMKAVIEEGRTAVRGMRLTQTDSSDLEKSFSRIRAEAIADEPANFRVLVEGPARALHALVRDDVYRIGREAIINAFRHSRATNVEVELRYSDRDLRLFVRDDGCGIEPQILRHGREGHWGLSGIRETAERIRAKLRLQSRLGEGTEVELTVPAEIAFAASPRPPARIWRRIFRPGSRTNEQSKNSP
jgi:signal transduction histidine kinase/ligand-binding sensor domain-containing protein